MIETHGLTHISLSVADPDRSLAFYERLFGVRKVHREPDSIQVKGPGAHDIIAFDRRPSHGKQGGIDHFGFRLKDAAHMEHAIREVEALGAEMVRQGEFSPGFPYLYVKDPDGYVIEIWFE